MANYLARVAAGGANTQTAARPPVVGPPLMPSAGAVLAPIAGALPPTTAEPRNEQALSPLLHAETSPVIYAPRALRPAPIRRPPANSAEPMTADDKIAPPLPPPASLDVAPTAHAEGPGVREQGIVTDERSVPVAHRLSRNPVEQATQPRAQAQIRPAQVARAGQEVATGGRIALPATSPSAARPPVRISIGQIDVQVNNRPPSPPARPAARVESGAADPLEQRGLERFRLRR